MYSLRFENNLLTIEGVRFASISKKTPLSKLSFAFVSLALPLLVVLASVYVIYVNRECIPTYIVWESAVPLLCGRGGGWVGLAGGGLGAAYRAACLAVCVMLTSEEGGD
jgi:hypothetical protein